MKDRQKMCLNCDARIPLSAGECPFCGAECAESPSSQPETPMYKHQALQDSLTALYPPPYSAKPTQTPPIQYEEPVKPAAVRSFQEAPVEKKSVLPILPQAALSASSGASSEEEEEKNVFWPLFLMSVGTTLLTLGLLQFFFSDQGVLKLEWDSTYWLLYCFASVPLLYFGYKKAS